MPVGTILPELHASRQQWWFNKLRIVVYTSASRIHHNRQPITGSHTLLLSVLSQNWPSCSHWLATWELHDNYLMKYWLSHHKHLNFLISIRVQCTLQLSYSVTVPQHCSPASVWVIFKQYMTIHEHITQVKSLWIMTYNIQRICSISTVNFPNHCQNLLACCFMPSFFNF